MPPERFEATACYTWDRRLEVQEDTGISGQNNYAIQKPEKLSQTIEREGDERVEKPDENLRKPEKPDAILWWAAPVQTGL